MATYYVSECGSDLCDGLTPSSAWKSIDKVNKSIVCGDTVLFCRGDIFFGQILPPNSDDVGTVTSFGAYGDGKKPVISQYKTLFDSAWEPCGEGVWRADLTSVNNFSGNITELDTNVGFIKADGSIMARKRFTLEALEGAWDFYNDEQFVYVRLDECPSLLAKDIKLACNIICMKFANGILVEDLAFIGSGAHGISGSVKRATVRGCEFHELGGSELLTYFKPGVRYGNGLECWTDSSDVLVENCRFSKIYDVAITMQGDNATSGWVNITFRNNVIYDCQQAFEIWSMGKLPDTGFQNCLFEGNECIDSGYCWSYDVRPDKPCACHLLFYFIGCPLCDVTVRSNIFRSTRLHHIYNVYGISAMPEDYKIHGNTFYLRPEQDIIFRKDATEEQYAAFFEKLSATNDIVYLEN